MLLRCFPRASWQSLHHSSASVRTPHGTGRLTLTLLTVGGCGRSSTTCGKIFALAGFKTCREGHDASAFLEMLRRIAGVCAETGPRKVRALEARSLSSFPTLRAAA